MCLIALAWQAHAAYPLIVAGNRDEFFARPAASAHWWSDGDRLAGRDLRAGGTWMGVSRGGRFAALTNHRDPSSQRDDAPSRGELVGDFLSSSRPPVETLRRIGESSRRFNGFNLLAADWRADPAGLWVVSNRDPSPVRTVEPGVHGLSNALLDTAWPKVEHATRALRDAIDANDGLEPLIAELFTMLADRGIADDARLPATGVPLDVERALSASFIRMPGYGTRASTVLVVDRTGRATFVERRREPDAPIDESRFSFVTDAA